MSNENNTEPNSRGESAISYADYAIAMIDEAVGGNTPGVIKYPIWQMTGQNPDALYICVNQTEAVAPKELESRAVCVDVDVGTLIRRLAESNR